MTDALPLAKTATPPGRGPSLETMGMSKAFGRFKALDDPFPFAVITSPADHRLVRGSSQRVDREFEVRALQSYFPG